MSRSRENADDLLIANLAGGATVTASAKLCDLSERTVGRRLADPVFRQRLAEARAAMLCRALDHLSRGAAEASVTLRKLLRSDDAKVQLGAARSILEAVGRLQESVDLEERIATLEAANLGETR
jgi:hypothetical protein